MPAIAPLRPIDLHRLRADHPDVRIIDVRASGEFAVRHIPGSYNVPLPDLAGHRDELRTTNGPVVLVCESGRRACEAEVRLAEAGLDRVHVLDGGVAAWEAGGHSVDRLAGDAPWTIERQIRLVAGGIVTTSVAASALWPPARFVAGGVGIGLAAAALTNTCAMGALLSKLPYNRRRAGTCDLPTVVSRLSPTSEVRS